MSDKRTLLLNFIKSMLFFVEIFSVAATVMYSYTMQWNFVGLLLLMIVPFAALFLFQAKVKNIMIFIIINVAVLIGVPVITAHTMLFTPAKVIISAFIIVAAIYFMYFRLRARGTVFELWNVIAAVIVQFIAVIVITYLEIPGAAVIPTAAAIVAVLTYILWSHINNMDSLLASIAGISAQSAKDVVRFNNRIIAFFVFLAAGAALLTWGLGAERLLGGLGGLLLAGIRFIAGLINYNKSAPEISDMGVAEPLEKAESAMMFERGEASPFMVYLEQVMMTLGKIAIVIGCIYLVFKLAVMLYRRFYTRGERDGDIKEIIKPDIKRESLNPFSGLLSRRHGFGRGPAGKLRKQYYQKINSHIKNGLEVKAHNTPGQIADSLREKENIDELTAMYEAARYGE